MKKTLSLIFAGLLLLPGFISCTQSDLDAETVETAADTEEIAETEASYLDTLGKKDFKGASFVFAVAQQGTLPACASELTGESVNDALYERDLLISQMYNVSIEYRDIASLGAEGANQIANYVFAGDYFSDLYRDALSTGKSYMGGAFRKGALYNLMDVPYLKLDQAWWSQLMYDQLQYNGKMFFTSGDLATASYYAPSCTFINMTVAEKENIDTNEIYNLVYDGTWTIDEMITRKNGLNYDLNGDGVINLNDDSYGVVIPMIELNATELLCSAGIRYSEIGEDGSLEVNLNTEHVVNVLDKLKQCYNEIKPGEDWSPFRDITFKSDRALFMVHFVTSVDSLRDMESDYAIVPMPKYDTAQESYISYTNPHSHSYVAIPLIQPDIERTGFITEVMEYLSVEMVRPTIYDMTLKGKLMRNPDSQAMLDIVFDTAYIDFNALNNFGGSTAVVYKALFEGSEFVSEYKKIENKVKTELEEYITLFD